MSLAVGQAVSISVFSTFSFGVHNASGEEDSEQARISVSSATFSKEALLMTTAVEME